MRRTSISNVLLILFSSTFVLGADVPSASWFPVASPLADPTAGVIRATNVEELFAAAQGVKPGGTILISDGHYFLPRYFEISTDDVTLRSESGKRNNVVLDGAKSRHGELIGISKCTGVTIADLTVQNVKWNGIKLNSDQVAQRVTIRNCVIHNIWQRGIKAPGLRKDAQRLSPRDCRIEYCLFYNDRPKQFSDDETDTDKSFNGNYIGGIDVKNTTDWTISHNVFIGIHGRTHEGRGCIYISEDGTRCTIEGNIFLDCDIAIALGNPSLEYSKHHAVDCVVRNNFVSNCPETGILACYTKDCEITSNTIHDPDSRLHRLIWVQNANEGLQVSKNLIVGPPMQVTSDSKIVAQDNVVAQRINGSPENVGQSFLAETEAADAVELPAEINESKQQAAEARLAPGQLSDNVIQAMRKVHAKFDGQAGYVAQFGDSITYSMAFWSPMSWDAPDKYLTADDGLPKTPKDQSWRNYVKGARDKGPKFANYSGWKVGQLDKAMDAVLKRDKPEVAIIMIGTNDISGGKVPQTYRAGLERVLQKCFDAHCVPILNTIPPRRGRDDAVKEINQIIRDVAAKENIPLADFHAECVRRRPNGSWDGTVISKDGVHPSGGKSNVYTEENLNTCGYALRNWVNFLALRQVYFRVLNPQD